MKKFISSRVGVLVVVLILLLALVGAIVLRQFTAPSNEFTVESQINRAIESYSYVVAATDDAVSWEGYFSALDAFIVELGVLEIMTEHELITQAFENYVQARGLYEAAVELSMTTESSEESDQVMQELINEAVYLIDLGQSQLNQYLGELDV